MANEEFYERDDDEKPCVMNSDDVDGGIGPAAAAAAATEAASCSSFSSSSSGERVGKSGARVRCPFWQRVLFRLETLGLLFVFCTGFFFSYMVMSGNDDFTTATSVYDFVVKNIKGEDVSLSEYKGNVLLIVNVASRCGYTATNYRELNELYEKYESKGLRILAFPCNQFAGQEPGDAEKICEFASKRNVRFDLFDKINVNGENAHPLWKYLKKEQSGTFGDFIKWNFTKFVVNREGKVVSRYSPNTNPSKIAKDLEQYL